MSWCDDDDDAADDAADDDDDDKDDDDDELLPFRIVGRSDAKSSARPRSSGGRPKSTPAKYFGIGSGSVDAAANDDSVDDDDVDGGRLGKTDATRCSGRAVKPASPSAAAAIVVAAVVGIGFGSCRWKRSEASSTSSAFLADGRTGSLGRGLAA